MIVAKLERLAAAHIQLLPALEITTHFVFSRDGFVALVERKGDDFGAVGAAGLLTKGGFAALTWRGERAWFVGKGLEREATPEEVNSLRIFQRDLDAALAPA